MRTVVVSFLLFVLVTGFVYGKSVRIRYEGASGLEYSLKRSERVHREYWNGKEQNFRYSMEKRLLEKVEKLEDGSLRRKVKQLQGKMKYLDEVEAVASKQPSHEERINALGEELANVPGAEGANPGRMRLVFPEEPVTVGSTWSYTAPASHTFPAPLKTKFRLVSFKEFRGHDCAYIKASTKYMGRHEDRNVDASLKSRGRIYFDIEKGVIISSVSSTRFSLRYLEDMKNSRPRLERRVIDIKYSLK